MADGNDPGPKGFRARIFALWARSAGPVSDPPSFPAQKPGKPPEPRPHPRGMARWKAPALPVRPVMNEHVQRAEHRRSYFETLKDRVRESEVDRASLVRRDFNRGRE